MMALIRVIAVVAVLLTGSTAATVAQTTSTALFPEVAVGSGFTTTFTLVNTGSTALGGNLILTLQKSDGPANVTVTDLALNKTAYSGTGSSVTVPVSILPGGTTFLHAAPTNPDDSLAIGWGRVESSGGALGGVATFAYSHDGQLQTIAGVLSSDLLPTATIPLDDDDLQQRYTGYSVANPSNRQITVKVMQVPADGNMANAMTMSPIVLGPGQQSATFFIRDPLYARRSFRGSAVLIGQSGATFCIIALVQVQGKSGPLYTAIPVIPSKSPNVN